MKDSSFPQIRVIDEWIVADELIRVQLVQVARNRLDQLRGGLDGIRVSFLDTGGGDFQGFILGIPVLLALNDGIAKALKRHEELTANE